MRSPRWFSPARDLAHVLRRLNAQSPSDTAERFRLERQLRQNRVGRETHLHKQLMAALVRRLRKRLAHAELFRFAFCRELIACAGANGLALSQAIEAWIDVWRVLYGFRPGLHARLGSCPWCGALVWRYRRQNHFCGVCGMAPRILRGREQQVANLISDDMQRILEIRRDSEKRFGRVDDAYARAYYGTVRQRLLAPMLRPVQEPIILPASVAHPQAFISIWSFVFDKAPQMLARVFQCRICERIAVRKDLRMRTQTCCTRCRLQFRRRSASGDRL